MKSLSKKRPTFYVALYADTPLDCQDKVRAVDHEHAALLLNADLAESGDLDPGVNTFWVRSKDSLDDPVRVDIQPVYTTQSGRTL